MATWNLSPTEELDASITWFKKRTPVGGAQMDAIADNARRQSFWMARVQTAQRARRIQQSLESAMAHGMDFNTWKRTNASKLRGIPRAHLETTFRNWTQTSYNQSRVDYLSHPAVMKRRPYWVFDAVIDGATTRVCTAYNGTVLPAGHPWWATHTPPLHHNCRSSIRGLTEKQAEKIGIRQRAPAPKLTKSKAEDSPEDLKPGPVKVAPGFGNYASEQWDPGWAPKRPELIPGAS